jgi:hypothetical protein
LYRLAPVTSRGVAAWKQPGARLHSKLVGAGTGVMGLDDPSEIARRLVELKVEHRDLDAAIHRLQESRADELQLRRLKKRKLALKDMIAHLESRLIPDLDA